MRKERGMSFLGFVILAAIGLSVVLTGIKIAPAYIEFFAVKNIIRKIGSEPGLADMSKKEIMDEFNNGANTGYVSVITGNDLTITKDENGKVVVTAEYQVVKPLAFNLSALMDFKATTEKQ